jgi:hypothetical protein
MLNWPDCPDVFAFWNDDYFRLAPLDNYQPEHRGPALDFGQQQMATQPSVYHASVLRTAQLLAERGYTNPLCYEVHAPIVVHADLLRDTFRIMADTDDVWQWRTAYGNIAHLQGTQVVDPKLCGKFDEPNSSGAWLSTSPLSWRGKAGRSIRNTYRDPSPYETP